ncbi:monomeric sarcosine oxidase [Caldalkalibacillus uzonensis]|uniref:Monomeric sarcosine oxidase n=1 Tax=Caldalkalibacillus uzonensis TaxID=353224 RepID=A0ABU0CNK3_9BACI|nr:N-methyl-L-tryptophan oxidase [Caldalkalibacillus uzonensis]MDQ0337993.1 monomeric sarcosine oxidase [Caldalkalibacillus uzonensis]
MKLYDVIIVGAGSMGIAAGYYLTKQGIKTLLIDSFNPPHHQGSHHGSTRIIRHAYGEGRQYVALALRAQELWYALEQESQQELFINTGVLGIGEVFSPFIKETIESAQTYNLPLEILKANEVQKRWPGIQIPEHYVGCLETTSGILYSEKCIQAYRDLTLENKGSLLCDTAVHDIKMYKDGVTVMTDNGTFHSDKLIVTAGAWTGKLLPELELPLQPVRKAFGWFKADESFYDSKRFPAFFFALPDKLYYGFPSIDGSGVKLGRHDGGQSVDPDQINRTFGADDSDESDLRSFLETFMPHASGALIDGKICIYTKTPDEHFIIDQHPEHDHVMIAAGFSGHGFKFSSVVGEILSEITVKGKTKHDISVFKLNRKALHI